MRSGFSASHFLYCANQAVFLTFHAIKKYS